MSWHPVPGAETLGDEEAMALEVAGKPVALCRSGGKLHAVHNVCTHQFALLSDGYVEDGCIECPLHQGRFDLRPARRSARRSPIRFASTRASVEDGKTYVRIPD